MDTACRRTASWPSACRVWMPSALPGSVEQLQSSLRAPMQKNFASLTETRRRTSVTSQSERRPWTLRHRGSRKASPCVISRGRGRKRLVPEPCIQECRPRAPYPTDEVSHAVMHHLALALETERDFFRHGHTGRNMTLGSSTTRLSSARPGGAKSPWAPARTRTTGVSRYCFKTTSEGLQIRRDNAWIDVPADPDLVVVNTGDLMAHWSNDRWPSTWHRVRATNRRRASDRLLRRSGR